MPKEALFPHLTSTGPAPTYIEVLTTYKRVFYERVAGGKLRPLVLPYHLYGCLLVLTYLYIPHTKSRFAYGARWPVVACVIWFQWKVLWETSSENQAVAFAAGLTAGWGVVWSLTWLLLCRPQWDAKRVQRRVVRDGRATTKADDVGATTQSNGRTNGEAVWQNGSHSTDPDKYVRKRTHINGTTKAETHQEHGDGETVSYSDESEKRDGVEYEYYWQSCPSKLSERIPWTMDLLMNFRGPGWNWAIPPMPALPPFVKAKIGEDIDEASIRGVSSVGLRRFDTRRDLFNYRIPQFIGGYFVLDILKTTIMRDPYYVFGPNTYALPSHLAALTTFQLKLFRQLLNSITVVVALEMVFMLMPLGMSLLCGPSIVGLRGEAWYYPSTWGPFSNILNKGLNGLWGGWWHQTFRFVFTAPANYLIKNGYVKARSTEAKLSGLFFAFGISGFLHAAGSVTQFALSHPWQAPTFFMLQALGILIQTVVCVHLRSQITQLPKIIRQAGNVIFTWTWLWYTSWLLVDDFARGGIWLWEPLPISPTRALGFGSGDDSWWCWGDMGIRWYSGRHWWDSGIAL
ncbi:hypothetical protein D0Z07_2876 [Hyphodiscus hymeniophilus]|uniref:Wax synthase domain-containing protein n=1 Tax=Hyphodiscus hymeniophilus TaxID=353542 RepID=A0A9P6VN76_9HELO|nr:hypothetical protein D0Z07_2876 [Hyphodiscus hymeniophilus]